MLPHRPIARSLVVLTALAVAPGAALADDPPKDAPAKAAPVATTPAQPAAAQPASQQQPAAAAAKPAQQAQPAAKPKAKAAKKKKKQKEKDLPITGPIATYPGFKMLDGGGSRVFVTLSKKVNVTEQKAEGKLTYRIQGVSVPTKTNRLPLLTAFFATPVSKAELVNRDGGDVDLVIDLRNKVAAQFRVIETDKGAELQVDFPKIAIETKDDGSPKAEASQGRPQTAKSLDSGSGTAY